MEGRCQGLNELGLSAALIEMRCQREKQGLEEESRGGGMRKVIISGPRGREGRNNRIWEQKEGRAGGGLLSLGSVSRGLLRSVPSVSTPRG